MNHALAMHLHKTPLDYQRVTQIKFLSSEKTRIHVYLRIAVNLEQAKK